MKAGDFVEILLIGEYGQVVKCSTDGKGRYLVRMKDLKKEWFLLDELGIVEKKDFLSKRDE